MILDILIGLITSGVYYVAQRHRDWLDKNAKERGRERAEISNSLEHGLKTIFPTISKKISQLGDLGPDQIKALKELIFRGEDELEYELQQAMPGILHVLSKPVGAVNENYLDMFSVQTFEETLKKIAERKDAPNLKPETITFIAPRLITLLLQEIAAHPALRDTFALIRDIQSARFQTEVLNHIQLDDKTILEAVNDCRRILYGRASAAYAIRLAGKEPDLIGRFDYLAPGLRKVKRTQDNRIPSDFDQKKFTEKISNDDFQALLLKKKRILIVAGAGVGKTTFLRRLHLEMMRECLKEASLPIFENVYRFPDNEGGLAGRVSDLLHETEVTDFSPDKAARITGRLNKAGRLCFLLDSVDQCPNVRDVAECFQEEAVRYFGDNIIVTACRSEQIKSDPDYYRRIFNAFEWVILDKFSIAQLEQYLGPDILRWLGYPDLPDPDPFLELLQIRFYANITRRLGLRPAAERENIKSRGDLLGGYVKELFREAKSRGREFNDRDKKVVMNFLYKLSLDTLIDNHKQWFPANYLDEYVGEWREAYDLIFKEHWIFFNDTLFEGRNEERYTFYHQLLQEYFAACRLKHLFGKDTCAFEAALERLEFSTVLLDLLDDLLDDEEAFNYCMKVMRESLAKANRDKQGIYRGHFFTWLLALRDRKGGKPGLKDELQAIFDDEMKESQETTTDGKFVHIPAGAFFMGSYEYNDEQPVRVVYLSDYWLSKYVETVREYKGLRNRKVKDVKLPVVDVSWDDANDYCNKDKRKGYFLSTEAQWEKAARGCFGRRYPWGNDPDKEKANYWDSGIGKTVDVDADRYASYMYGLHQMSGNVWEWCRDVWDMEAYKKTELVDPEFTGEGASRISRGGGWGGSAVGCRMAGRYGFGRVDRGVDVGFRLARTY